MARNDYIWTRSRPLDRDLPSFEIWELEHSGSRVTQKVSVRFGKSMDLSALKRNSPFIEEVRRVGLTRHAFDGPGQLMTIEACPACGAPKSEARASLRIWDSNYAQCQRCGHAFADRGPTNEALERYYSAHSSDADYYIRPEEVELRLREIYRPKLDWVLETYHRHFGREACSLLDMGAGAGHFLHAAKERGLAVAGLECDTTYQRWCREQFGIELVADASLLDGRNFDIVCSFNVIEHTFAPTDFVAQQVALLGPNGLLVTETPKFNALTSAVRALFPESVRTHLIPYKHNHLFTDASLATLLHQSGLAVSDVWYFGQDIGELLCQTFNACGADIDMAVVGRVMEGVQKTLDCAGLSDLMLVAALRINDNLKS